MNQLQKCIDWNESGLARKHHIPAINSMTSFIQIKANLKNPEKYLPCLITTQRIILSSLLTISSSSVNAVSTNVIKRKPGNVALRPDVNYVQPRRRYHRTY